MKHIVLALLLTILAGFAFADDEKKPEAPPEPSVGKSVAHAVNVVVSAITTDGNRLADSQVGRFTIAMVAWRIMGKKVVQWSFGFVFMWTLLIIWYFSFRKNCLRRVVMVKDQPDDRTFTLITPKDESGLAHGFALAGIIIASSAIMFWF